MITTEYECDSCGHTQDDDVQMWIVLVTFTPYNKSHSHAGRHTTKSKLWCRKCVIKNGLIITTTKPNDPPPPLVTLEDLVREIAEEVCVDLNT